MASEQHQPHYSRMSLAALVAGLVSLPTAFLPFGIIVALAAVILSFAARREATGNARPIKMANAALVMSLIAVLIWVAVITGFALFAWVYES